MNKNKEITINTTLKVKAHNVVDLENWLKKHFNLISFEHIQNTDNMYKEDVYFKKLVKQSSELKKQRIDYIMKNNHKYNDSKK